MNGTTTSRHLSVCTEGEQYLAELLNHGVRELSVRTYRHRLKKFGEWLAGAGLSIEQVDRDILERWFTEQRETGLSPKTRRDNRSVAIGFFDWLVDRGALPANPVARIRPIKVPRKLPEILQESEVIRMLEVVKTGRERVIGELLYGSGLRRAEILGIEIEDLHLAAAEVLIRGKGGKERMQPISSEGVDAVRAWMPERARILEKNGQGELRQLLVTCQGVMSPQTVVNVVKALAARAGLGRRVYPHLMRHCFATHLLNRGLDLRQVQELMDHANVATTQIYTHISRPDLKAAYVAAHPRSKPKAPAPASEQKRVNGGTVQARGDVAETSQDVRFRLVRE